MIEIKLGVRLFGVREPVWVGVRVAEGLWAKAGVDILVVTSGMDSRHSDYSGHYRGDALDVRTKTLPPGAAKGIMARLATALGEDYFIKFEDEGGANEHGHIEWRPKGPYRVAT